jgi:predicted amidophosphoribosyltransferase
MTGATTTPALPCRCYRPREQRLREVLEVQCHRCGRTIELSTGANRCPCCGAELQIAEAPFAGGMNG